MSKLKVGDSFYCTYKSDGGYGWQTVVKVGRKYYYCAKYYKYEIDRVDQQLDMPLKRNTWIFKDKEDSEKVDRMFHSIRDMKEKLYGITYDQFEKIQKILEEV